MSTEADIKNWALTRIGQMRILDVDTSNANNAEVVNAEYPLAVDHCLRLADWSFATRRIKLSPETTPPQFGYDYSFLPPEDMINIQSVVDAYDVPIKYAHENGKILSNTAAINLVYTSNDRDHVSVSVFTPEFKSLLRLAIAKEIAYPITLSEPIAQSVNNQFEDAKIEYLSLDNKGDDFDPVSGNQPFDVEDDFGGIFK